MIRAAAERGWIDERAIVLENGRDALARKLEYLENLCGEARRLRDEGKTLQEITRSLVGREDSMSWLTRFHFCKRNLIRSCLEASAGAAQS